MDEGMKGRKI